MPTSLPKRVKREIKDAIKILQVISKAPHLAPGGIEKALEHLTEARDELLIANYLKKGR